MYIREHSIATSLSKALYNEFKGYIVEWVLFALFIVSASLFWMVAV